MRYSKMLFNLSKVYLIDAFEYNIINITEKLTSNHTISTVLSDCYIVLSNKYDVYG